MRIVLFLRDEHHEVPSLLSLQHAREVCEKCQIGSISDEQTALLEGLHMSFNRIFQKSGYFDGPEILAMTSEP